MLAVQDRKYYIKVGYGLEPILPDGRVGGFGREAVPYLKNGDYDGAVSLLTSRIVDVIAKDAGVEITTSQPRRIEPLTSSPQQTELSPGKILAIIIVIIIVLAVPPLRQTTCSICFCSGGLAVVAAVIAAVVAAVSVVAAGSAVLAEAAPGAAAREVAGEYEELYGF